VPSKLKAKKLQIILMNFCGVIYGNFDEPQMCQAIKNWILNTN
jgi:hypothetical protein